MKPKLIWGKWDSWGFGINYCHYTRGLTVEFIHWYVCIEFWTNAEVEELKEVIKRFQEFEREDRK